MWCTNIMRMPGMIAYAKRKCDAIEKNLDERNHIAETLWGMPIAETFGSGVRNICGILKILQDFQIISIF